MSSCERRPRSQLTILFGKVVGAELKCSIFCNYYLQVSACKVLVLSAAAEGEIDSESAVAGSKLLTAVMAAQSVMKRSIGLEMFTQCH
jgi:hypothetical protein